MPSRKVHNALDTALFGRSFDKVHKLKDKPARFLGPSHRRVLHDPLSNLAVALTTYPEDPLKAMIAATLHDLVDSKVTEAKRRIRRR